MEEHCTPIQASALKKGQHVILQKRPCKIIEMSTSKTGKHGHAKIHFHGKDVFTGAKYEDICPSTHNMLQPVLVQTKYDLTDIDADDYTTLMDESGDTHEDFQLNMELQMCKDVKAAFDDGKYLSVTILSWGEERAIISFVELKD